jgi:uncharacterized membrane protein YvlD (DUF360 family)
LIAETGGQTERILQIGIISAIIEPNFWISSLWMFICGGWVLSIIASIIGYYIGRKLKVDDMNSA